MDLYNIVTKIPYLIMLGVGLVLILQIYVGGLQDISASIDEHSLNSYDKAVAAEQVLNLDEQRGVIDVDFFDEGYSSCYFNEIENLDGNYLEYRISTQVSDDRMEDEFGVGCLDTVSSRQSFQTQIILVDENHKIPATLYIYARGEGRGF